MTRTLLVLALGFAFTAAHADTWSYRGTLTDGGKPANGSYDIRLSLLDAQGAETIGTPLTIHGVAVKDGNFAVDADFGIDLSLAPALKLKTEVQQGSSGFVALGEPTGFDAKAALAGVCWDTEGNAGTNPATNFIGTTDNQPFNIRANNSRIGQFTARGTPSSYGDAPSVALGSSANVASAVGATVSGGGATRSSSGTPSSGQNQATEQFSTVSGGVINTASGSFSTVSGGTLNTARGSYSVVGGGANNLASGSYSVVSGGSENFASGTGSTVSGLFSCAGGDRSWAGGTFALTRPGNEPGDGTCGLNSGDSDGDNGTFVWADDQNDSFISTGPKQFLIRSQGGMAINSNTPALFTDLTLGGSGNLVMRSTSATTGNLSFGAQTRQMLNLFDSGYGIGVQSARMYFRVNPSGGFAWYEGGTHDDGIDVPGAGGTLRMRLNAAGQLQTTTGTISTLSDARLKDHVHDYTGALDQINALRPVNYHYIEGGKAAFQPAGEHVGFIAQELQQVFPEWVLEGDDGYLQLSMRGFEAVAVRGMQELSAENARLDDHLATLRLENAELRSRLEAIEARLAASISGSRTRPPITR
jgi:hypothetical protein